MKNASGMLSASAISSSRNAASERAAARIPCHELIVAREGFGYLIGFLGANGSYDSMYAVVLTVAFLGFIADRSYQMLMNRMLQWREQTP